MRKVFIVCLILMMVSTVYASQIVRIMPLTIGVKSTAVSVGNTATALPATALAGRESIAIYNNEASDKTIYVGASDVSTANGFALSSNNPSMSIDLDDSVVLYAIVASGTCDVRVLEAK